MLSAARDLNSSRDMVAEPVSPRRIMLRPNQMYFPGRNQDFGQNRFQGPKYHFVDSARRGHGHGSGPVMGEQESPGLMPNPFGIMKDISVNNIVASDKDKMKDFSEKDFSQLFGKKTVGDVDIEAVVFEPRPCPVASQQHPWRLASYKDKTQDYASRPDQWQVCSDAQEAPSSGTTLHSVPCPLQGSYMLMNSHNGKPGPCTSSEQKPRQLNLEESLDHALQNLNDLTRNLTRDDSMDSIDMVIDSKVLESLLQGAEGYAKESNPDHSETEPAGGATVGESEQTTLPPTGQLILMPGRSEHAGNEAGMPTDARDKEDAVYV